MKLDNSKFYLIGKRLSHSYSCSIHKYFNYSYTLKEIEPENLGQFIREKNYDGLNITIPYKKDVICYLDKLDKTALEIGAVNTIKNDNGNLIGYNTDILGIEYLFNKHKISFRDKKIVILGTGGASNTVATYAKNNCAKEIIVIGRKTSPYNYENVDLHYNNTDILVNTTPVGMYPNNGIRLIDITPFSQLECVVDAIYNPLFTDILLQAKEKRIKYVNGLEMLVAQAKKSRDIFLNDYTLADNIITKITNNLISEKQNIVLIGMPASGKSEIGQILSKHLKKSFVDSDKIIEKNTSKKIVDIINNYGEKHFREIETEVISALGKENNQIISTGGGAILDKNAYLNLKQNGIIIWLKRDFDTMATLGRPLSKSKENYDKLLIERTPIYGKFADIIIENNSNIDSTIEKIMEALQNYGNISN
ncbi:MAG: shikimate kinase [Clostridia bacterium]